MKKTNIFIIAAMVLVLSGSVLAIECSKNIDCDDGLKYTKDICDNAGTEDSYCINEISNPNLSLLGKILDALRELIQKDWTINVEPTPITIEPNITVTPEIVLLETECQWEKINQRIPVTGISGGFVLPNEIDYSDMNIQKVSVSGECSGNMYSGCRLMFNEKVTYTNHCLDISCYHSTCNENLVYDVTTNCLSELVEGTNDFSILGGFDIKEFYVEMEVLPANC